MKEYYWTITIIFLSMIATEIAWTQEVKIESHRDKKEKVIVIAKSREHRSSSSTPKVVAKWEVKGAGTSERLAREDALQVTADALDRFLAEKMPWIEWRPDDDYIRKHLANEPVERLPEQDREIMLGNEKVAVMYVKQPVTISQQNIQDFIERDKDLRSKNRLVWATKSLGIVLFGVFLFYGYLRVEEWTKGYLTKVLVVTGLVVLSLAVMGVFIIEW